MDGEMEHEKIVARTWESTKRLIGFEALEASSITHLVNNRLTMAEGVLRTRMLGSSARRAAR